MYQIDIVKFNADNTKTKTTRDIYSEDALFAELTCLENAYAVSKDFKNGKIVAAKNENDQFECDVYSENTLLCIFKITKHTLTVFDVLKKETENFHKNINVEIQDSSGKLIRFIKFSGNEKKFLNEELTATPVISHEKRYGNIIITI